MAPGPSSRYSAYPVQFATETHAGNSAPGKPALSASAGEARRALTGCRLEKR